MNQNYYIYKNEKILINVSGMHFETWSWTLARFPKTLLGDPNKRKKYFDYIHNEYFFERHRQSFESILYYYQSNGRFLIRPMSVSSEVFFDEIVFFELGEEVINKYKRDEGYMIDKEANMSELPTNRLKRSIWLLFEYPHSSIFARLIAVISVVVVVVSITIFCVETLPDVKARRTAIAAGGGGGGSSSISGLVTTTSISSSSFLVTSPSPSSTTSSSSSSSSSSLSAIIFSASSSSSPSFSSSMTPNGITSSRPPTSLLDDKNRSFPLMTSTQVAAVSKIKDEFFVIESICILWFSIELVMRFYSAPNRLKFAKQFGNIIDFLSILPYFMETTDTSAKFSFLRIIRLVRVFRIFKLARHFKGLQILAHTLRASLNELMLLMFFLIVGVVLFSSMVYYTELDDSKSDFHSIPDGFWYAIITMTTVGYGEIVPKTTMGKIIGCFCAIAGVLTIALPVPIIVSHFQYFSRSNETLKKVNKETLRASNNLRANSNGRGSGAAQVVAKTDSLGRRCSSIVSGSYGLGEFIEMRNKTSTASTPVASNNCTRRPSRIITNRV